MKQKIINDFEQKTDHIPIDQLFLDKTGCFRLTKTMKRPGIIYLTRYLRNNVCGEGNAPEVEVEGSFPFTNVALCYKQLVKIKKEERRKRYIR